MARGKLNIKQKVKSDYLYKDNLIEKFINIVMIDGKKSVASKIVYGSLDAIKENLCENFGTVPNGFKAIIDKISPTMNLVSKKIGGSVYQVPTTLSDRKRVLLGMKLLKASAAKATGKTYTEKLTDECTAILNNKGHSLKQAEDIKKSVEAKRAYAHLA